MKKISFIIIAILSGISLACVWNFFLVQKEKISLADSLNNTKIQLQGVQQSKQTLAERLDKEIKIQEALNQQNSQLKEEISASELKLTKIESDFNQAQVSLDQLELQVSLLKTENTELRNETESKSGQLTQLSQERDNLNARLNSIDELKKILKELKRKNRPIKKIVQKTTKKVNKEVEQLSVKKDTIEGNRGYLLKQGKPTYPAKVIIEVTPIIGE